MTIKMRAINLFLDIEEKLNKNNIGEKNITKI